MSPLGQFPNFLTDGSRIRRPPVDDTKNPTFRRHPLTSKNFQYPASGRSPGSVFPALFSFIRACAAFLSRFRHFCPDIYLIANYYYLFPFQHPLSRQSSAIFCRQFSVQVFKESSPFFSMFSTSPPCQFPCSLICRLFPVQRFPFPTSAFPAIVRHFLPSIFRAGFQRKLPVLFYVQHFSPLSVSLFSHLPPFPGSTIFSARRLCCLSPVITYFYSSPAPRSGLPSRFSPASDETAPLSALLPIRFPAAPAHDPKVLLSSHPARQMVLPGLKIKISYPYQCYHKDGKGYQILFVVKVVTF